MQSERPIEVSTPMLSGAFHQLCDMSPHLITLALRFAPNPHDLISPHPTSMSHAHLLTHSLRAVERTQVAVPANTDNVDKQDAMIQRDKLEVDGLHKRPDHVVGSQGVLVVLVKLIADGTTLEHGHGGQEHADGAGCKNTLIKGDAGEDGGVGGAEVHVGG